jgi:hypothetical protein
MLGALTFMLVVLAALPLAATAASYVVARRRGETGTEPLGVGAQIRGLLRETGAGLAVVAALPLRLRPARPRTVSRGVALLIPSCAARVRASAHSPGGSPRRGGRCSAPQSIRRAAPTR